MDSEFFTSKDVPPLALAFVGIAALWIALKAARVLFKLVLGLAAVALFGAAIWWHLHHR